MTIFLWIISIYIILGIFSSVAVVIKEPIILHGWWLLIAVVFVWPLVLYLVFFSNDTSGRWI